MQKQHHNTHPALPGLSQISKIHQTDWTLHKSGFIGYTQQQPSLSSRNTSRQVPKQCHSLQPSLLMSPQMRGRTFKTSPNKIAVWKSRMCWFLWSWLWSELVLCNSSQRSTLVLAGAEKSCPKKGMHGFLIQRLQLAPVKCPLRLLLKEIKISVSVCSWCMLLRQTSQQTQKGTLQVKFFTHFNYSFHKMKDRLINSAH